MAQCSISHAGPGIDSHGRGQGNRHGTALDSTCGQRSTVVGVIALHAPGPPLASAAVKDCLPIRLGGWMQEVRYTAIK